MINRHNQHKHKCSPRWRGLFASLCAAVFLLMPGVNASQMLASVATAVIAVGEVQHLRGGQVSRLGLGQSLQEGDRIVTGRDGMAILVFIDQARVSLRSESELIISKYRLSQPGKPADMQLELVRGAMRQISGDAMRAEPERYRLNTPVAAIGVRGTDFLAKASNESLETFIQEGAILLMPLGNGCAAAQDSRACTPIDLLSSTDLMRYVRLSNTGQLQRRGMSAGELEQLFGIKLARGSDSAPTAQMVAAPVAPAAQPQVSPSVAPAPAPVAVVTVVAAAPQPNATSMPDPVQSSAQEAIVAELVMAADTLAAVPPAPLNPEPAPVPEPPAPPPVVVPDPTPAPLPMPTQLVWGRYATASAIPVTPVMTLPVSYAQASEGRHVTVGEPFEYALWREGTRGSIDKGLRGQVSYSFVAGEAYFQAAGAAVGSQATIDSAKLSIDFDLSRFDSAFKVTHSATGQVSIAASGRMNDEGVFTGGTNLELVAGALSKDGTEAGALFTKSIEAGTVRGISLFRRP
jgi:hypothetical protein